METPSQLSAAIGRFSEDAAWIAGGTDMQLQRRQHLVRPARLVSVMELAELRDIRHEADGSIAVGAAVTLADLQSALSAELPVLAEAIATIASPQIREMATVGGNLLQAKRCWFYRNDFPCYKRMGGLAPCYAINGDHRFYHAVIDGHRCQAVTPSDLATVLVALDAHAVIRGAGGEERAVRLSQLYRGPGESVLRHQELMVEVRIPAAAGRRLAAFEKLRLWEGDFAVASACVAAQVDSGDSLANVRVVLGAVAPVPWRALRTERALEGRASSTVLELCEAPALRRMLDDEINASAHPLARNAWKLDAAVGLAEQAAERLAKQLRLAD
ncbi:MAG: xanthine dehydrogenase family protein subunit M [Burkholderiaceae bacterium]